MSRLSGWGGRRAGRVAGLLVVATVGLACGLGPVGGEDPRPPAEPAPSAEATRADGTTGVEEFEDDIQGAVGEAERYWEGRFGASGQRFQPIRRVFAYQQAGEVSCGGQAVPRNNAVYCPEGDFIAYDVTWAVQAFRRIGDAFLFYLLGHEYAHGVQVRLGIRYDYTIQQELQADCMAGAYIGDSVRNKRLTLERGDLDELREGLFAVGDEPGQPWFAEGAHGSAEQRTRAFFAGYERSLAACDLP
ncbi:MAG TPA: neutral zinc metallopeptidase [Micromonospora sp.]